MIRTLVRVTMVARKDVLIRVAHEEDEDPCDPNDTELAEAERAFFLGQDVEPEVERIEVATP